MSFADRELAWHIPHVSLERENIVHASTYGAHDASSK